MSRPKGKQDPALEQDGFKRRLFCWMRQRRAVVAVHKTLYYDLSEPMLKDLQFDFIEAELEAVEKRHPDIAIAVTADGYWSPSSYVDSPRLPEVTRRARMTLTGWEQLGRPRLEHIPIIRPECTPSSLYEDALKEIVTYPI